jgi:hypothetical protein
MTPHSCLFRALRRNTDSLLSSALLSDERRSALGLVAGILHPFPSSLCSMRARASVSSRSSGPLNPSNSSRGVPPSPSPAAVGSTRRAVATLSMAGQAGRGRSIKRSSCQRGCSAATAACGADAGPPERPPPG